MAHLSEIYIKADILKTLAETVAKKGDKGISITVSTDDKASEYGQNLWAYVSQSKEEREAKKPRYSVGNGKVFWSDGNTPFVPKKEDQSHTPKKEYARSEFPPSDAMSSDELPF